MTIYGPDISSYEAGLDLSRLADASFAICKASEGTYYTDEYYQGWRRQAASLKRPFVWYHFLSTEGAAAQVAHTKACVGDLALPGMLDVEPEGDRKATLAQVLAYADEAKAAGLRLRLVYLPRWYWQELGSPSLSGLAARGLALVSSSYPGGAGSAPALYPGDKASGWNAYGGVTPALYQYTNQAADGGRTMDYNAFRGTLEQLLALLDPTSGGDVQLTDTITVSPGFAQKYPDAAGDGFTAGAQIPVSTLLLGSAIRAAHTDHQLAAQAAKLALLGTLDVQQLAAALAPLLQQGATADQMATAVVAHLATTLAKG